MSKQRIDLTGRQYGSLTVLSFFRNENNSNKWTCQCECGKITYSSTRNLNKNTRSCGCKKIPFKKHGLGETKIYDIWWQMKDRCFNHKNKSYKNYGNRGITVCDEWKNDLNCFLNDMGEPPIGMSLERIDNNLGYSKENCKWATKLEQSNNRRCTILVKHNGVDITISDLANKINCNRKSLYFKYKNGEDLSSIEKINKRGAHSKRTSLIKPNSNRNKCNVV
jgi:hypothetical protein